MFQQFGKTKVTNANDPHVIANVKSEDRTLYEKFIKEYDADGDLKFNTVNFRKGAGFTCSFGLAEGFKYINDKMEWGYVRNHGGVDRARGKDIETKYNGVVKDPVIVPFNFNRSLFYAYGDKSYGTLTCLINDEYGFQLRVAHMNPDQKKRKGNEKGAMLPWFHKRAKAKKSFERDWVLGSAGTLGASSGAHTHTELKSMDESCEVFDILLSEKFGDATLKEYTSAQVIKEYKKQKHFKEATDAEILKDYAELKKIKKIIFLNKYKCQYVDWDKSIKTRYSSQLLFGM